MDEQSNRQVQAAYQQACAAYGQMQQAYRAVMEIFDRLQSSEDSSQLRQEYFRALDTYNASQAACKQAQADYKQVQAAWRQAQLEASASQAPSMAAPQPLGEPAAGEEPLAEEDAAIAEGASAARIPVADQTAGDELVYAGAQPSVPLAEGASAARISVADQTADDELVYAGARPSAPLVFGMPSRSQGNGPSSTSPRAEAETGIPLGGPLTPEQAASARFWVKFAYILLVFFPLVTILFDYAKCYDYQGDPMVSSHITYQINTFWTGFVFTVLALVLPVVVYGNGGICSPFNLFIVGVSIWLIGRCIKGFLRLCDNLSV